MNSSNNAHFNKYQLYMAVAYMDCAAFFINHPFKLALLDKVTGTTIHVYSLFHEHVDLSTGSSYMYASFLVIRGTQQLLLKSTMFITFCNFLRI